ncbi:uncharacterized protein J8A68_006059 [[Candida] subhashii]|uniref:SHSP domain-containing protein n=1 Tax=[Candida] subhashii TaxID=561895 RepID=A0A8J5QCU6_9ASCO|nr:uncharacterized protein J8A68_006059 [[Candida] subhashii]KAG7660433.1 hypothetical protein J8A68_006059 [[Candida] subhashii]
MLRYTAGRSLPTLIRSSYPTLRSSSRVLVQPIRSYLTWYTPPSRLFPLLPREFDYDWNMKDDYFTTKEEKDKYLVTIKDKNLNDKQVKIDFNKSENSLLISINQNLNTKDESKGSESTFQSKFNSKYVFDKSVKVDEIVAEHVNDNVIITIPKVEPTPEEVEKDDIVNISLNKKGPTEPSE